MKTLILGASDNPERYSYKALSMLMKHGHSVVLVHPTLKTINNIQVYNSIGNVKGPIDTITVYVSPGISDPLEADLLTLKPRRVIFNPGAENPRLARALRAAGIKTQDACTLVLLQTHQYDDAPATGS